MHRLDLTTSELHITTDTTILDRGIVETAMISIASGVRVEYAYIPLHDGMYTRAIHMASGVRFQGTGVIATHETRAQISTVIEGDDVRSDLYLLALATDGANIRVEWVSRVDRPYRQIHTRVDQTNILIGQGARVSGLPILQIATDDVEGGHSCKVHRIGGDALFYLQSRGLEQATAEQLLLDSEICRHLETAPADIRATICQEIHHMIQK
jgi:Fe-S cluster assembly scaffold protein SufB